MNKWSELLDQQVNGKDIRPNPNNKITKKRKGMKKWIGEEAGGNKDAAFAIAMNSLRDHGTRLQEYVLSKSEEPAPNFNDLVKQVYQLRQNDIGETSDVLDFNNEEALTHLEEQEDQFQKDNGYVMDSFLGHLMGPIEIAYSYMQEKQNKPDGLDSGLLGGILNVFSEKLNTGELVRAAQGKPAGIVGTLATGGKTHYDALVDYFRKNPAQAQRVIAGGITDESQLPGWQTPLSGKGAGGAAGGAVNKLIKPIAGQALKSAIPYIIAFLVIVFLIVYFANKSAKK